MGKEKFHKECGGIIKAGVCSKCGKTWGKVSKFLEVGIEKKSVKFDEAGYKKRIRQGKDILR